jgi:hypothetical protein
MKRAFRHIHEYYLRILFSSEYFHYKTFLKVLGKLKVRERFQGNLSRPGIIDAVARYRAAARRFRNTAIDFKWALVLPYNAYLNGKVLTALPVKPATNL